MKVGFSDTFSDSLKTLHIHNTWWYKTYSLFRYDIPRFFKNVWMFRIVLWEHRWWDYRFHLLTLRTSLEIMEKDMHGGYEIKEDRDKKIAKMQRAIEILKNFEEDDFLELAQKELGIEYEASLEFEEVPGETELFQLKKQSIQIESANRKISKRSKEMEEERWKELWKIFQGQDYKKFKKEVDWHSQFDGSGMRGWWD